MTKRTKLSQRELPRYCKGEEMMNMVTHIVGGVMAIGILLLCLWKAKSPEAMITCCIYGSAMIALYTVSSVYHGLRAGMGKKVMQVIDHCTIYFLIAGTYTPLTVLVFAPAVPAIGWGMLAAQWGLAAIACALTAIDLKKYRAFSMVCYIGMGWGVILFLPLALRLMEPQGFGLLLAGGIAYTIGAVLYGLGKKLAWMHGVFHIFVVLGSLLQFLSIYFYVL